MACMSIMLIVNTLSVYLHDLVWGQDPEGLYNRMEKFLELCNEHGMRVLFVFFDDCHCPDPVCGKQPPVLKAVHNSGWAQSPGRDLVTCYHGGNATKVEKKRLQGYVQETMRCFRNDTRVLHGNHITSRAFGGREICSAPVRCVEVGTSS